MSPSLAFGWYIWTRHRLGLTLCAGYWMPILILTRILPVKSLPLEQWVVLLALPFMTVVAYLIAIFSIGLDARLDRRESGFPARLWVLPLRTRSLVGWPMLGGTAVLALAWLTLPWEIVQSPGIDLTNLIWLPVLLLTVGSAWLQALMWSPFPLPGLRLLVLLPWLGAALIVPQWLMEGFHIHKAIGYGLYAIQLPIAYLTAVYGVSRARRGAVLSWNWPGWPAWLRWTSATTVGRPFLSPARAQLWFEWRRTGHIVPSCFAGFALSGFWYIPWLAYLLEEMARKRVPFVPWRLIEEIGGMSLALGGWLLIWVTSLSYFAGIHLGKLPGREPMQTLSSFLATRPVSTALLIRAKFEMAALSTLAGWGVILIGMLIWLTLGGNATAMKASIDALRMHHSPGPFWCSITLFFISSLAWTWFQMIQGLWVARLERIWWIFAYEVFIFYGYGTLVVYSAWLANNRQHWQSVAVVLPWLAGGVVVLKVGVAVYYLRALKRREILPQRVFWGLLATWIIFVTGLFAVLCWLLPAGRTSVAAIVLGLALMVPLTRLALAPLALDWRRHG